MPNKKQSASPADSEWLLEVGVIGIVKTLELLELTGWSLLEVEQVLRPCCRGGFKASEKAKLPWLKIPPAPWDDKKRPAHLLGSWEECLALATVKKGKALTNLEWEELARDWHCEWPGQDEADRLSADLEEFEKDQKGKGLSRGKGREKEHRPPLEKWMIDDKIMKLFRSGPLENDTERKKLERIKAHSLALSGALKEIAGKGRAKSEHYPKKLAEIIKHSRALALKRKEFLAKQIAWAEGLIKEHDAKRIHLLFEFELLRERWKKVGKVSR